MTRDKVLEQAVEQCMKELYTYAQPKVSWEDFIKENNEYSKNYIEWKNSNSKDSKIDCLGPAPYEFYYLPKEIMKEICDSYIYAYKIDSKQEFLDNIETLKDYCKKPIVDKYIEGELREDGTRWPGHRGYDHPKNLKEQIKELLGDIAEDNDYYPNRICEKFFEFLDMAGKFYNWNRDLNSFNVSIYLGASPNSNKEKVIENWKQYRNKDVEIDDRLIEKEFYGEDDID